MTTFNRDLKQFLGPGGYLQLLDDDQAALKLAMLIEGECGLEGSEQVAKQFGYTRQRYYQVKQKFLKEGILGLVSKKRGPRSNYRRKEEIVCQTIRLRFLDPDASAEVIAQKLKQLGFKISIRSVERIISQFGLQKKTLRIPTESEK